MATRSKLESTSNAVRHAINAIHDLTNARPHDPDQLQLVATAIDELLAAAAAWDSEVQAGRGIGTAFSNKQRQALDAFRLRLLALAQLGSIPEDDLRLEAAELLRLLVAQQ